MFLRPARVRCHCLWTRYLHFVPVGEIRRSLHDDTLAAFDSRDHQSLFLTWALARVQPHGTPLDAIAVDHEHHVGAVIADALPLSV